MGQGGTKAEGEGKRQGLSKDEDGKKEEIMRKFIFYVLYSLTFALYCVYGNVCKQMSKILIACWYVPMDVTTHFWFEKHN